MIRMIDQLADSCQLFDGDIRRALPCSIYIAFGAQGGGGTRHVDAANENVIMESDQAKANRI